MVDKPGPAVETIGLRKTFGDVVAVDGLDLRVEAGSFFGFLGPNGAGKSTTIKILTGLLVLSSMSALLSLMGNFTSVAFPESRPVSSLTSSASPTGTLMMIGCLLLGVTFGGIVVFGAALLKMPALQSVFACIIFAAVIGAYRPALQKAARTLDERRDDVFHALGVN